MRHKKKLTGESEIDLKPFMNIIVTLIPVLLMSAEFAKVAIIDIKLPENRASATQVGAAAPANDNSGNKLLLTAIVTDSVVTLGAKGGFMPSLYYKEFDRYVAKDDRAELTVEYKPGQKVHHPKTGREMTIYERDDIYLYVVNSKKEIAKVLYSKQTDAMITDANGDAVIAVQPGQIVYTVTNPRMMVTVKNPDDFVLKPMSAYDELKNRLMKVKERYQDAEDANDIIIAAGNQVIYDKIVQIMDVARSADYPNISIAKLRM
jgi:biopolymer transport protein ExbD